MNPIIKIKRGTTTPVSLSTGELAVDLQNKNLFVGDASGLPLAIGGEGTFATKAYADAAVAAGTGALGTMSTQNANAVAITGGAINGTAIGATTAASGAFTTLTASSAPSASTDVVRKTDLDSAISALGSVFRYIGDVTGTDLDAQSDTTTGAYYRVNADGNYTASGGYSVAAKVGDAFVKTSTGWQKLDNVDAVVSGTANEISVSGDENAGYTVSLDPVFLAQFNTAANDASYARSQVDTFVPQLDSAILTNTAQEIAITDLQTKTQNIDLAGTTAGTTMLTGNLVGTGTNQITDFIIDGGVY